MFILDVVWQSAELSCPESLKRTFADCREKLQEWVLAVGEHTLEEVRKLSGYHDEP